MATRIPDGSSPRNFPTGPLVIISSEPSRPYALPLPFPPAPAPAADVQKMPTLVTAPAEAPASTPPDADSRRRLMIFGGVLLLLFVIALVLLRFAP